jgi:hypothetical protein
VHADTETARLSDASRRQRSLAAGSMISSQLPLRDCRRLTRHLLKWMACLLCVGHALSATASGATLTVTWERGVGSTVGYLVSVGTTSGSYDLTMDAGNRTMAKLAGLLDHTTYFIAVRAYDASGLIGLPSDEVVLTTDEGPSTLQIMCRVPMAVSVDGSTVAVLYPELVVAGGAMPTITTCTPRSGSSFAPGITPIECSTRDADGNTAFCRSAVVVKILR